MQTCPKCKQLIDDDSWYCDQCGAELMVCPQCRTIKRGMRCNQCGSPLIKAKDFAQKGSINTNPSTPPNFNSQNIGPAPTPKNHTAEVTPQLAKPQDIPGGYSVADPVSQPNANAGRTVSPQVSQPVNGQDMDKTVRTDAQQATMRPVAPQQPKPTHLVCQTLGKRLGIGNGAVIGRRGDYAEVFVGQGFVSGLHARLQYNATGNFEVVDLGSTNGTFVNGVQLVPNMPQMVNIGDVVKFANLEFKAEP